MRVRTLVIAAAILVGMWGLTGSRPAEAVSKDGDELQKIKATEQEERRILADLEDIEKQIDQTEDRLARIERDIGVIEGRLEQGSREIQTLQGRLNQLEKYLRARLRAIYRLKDGGLLPILLKADSLSDVVYRYRSLSLILDRDARAMREFGQRQSELQSGQERLKTDRSSLYQLKVDIGAEKEKLLAARHKKTTLLMEIHQRKELYLALQRNREESRQRLLKEVIIRPDDRPDPPPPATGQEPAKAWPDFAALKGKLSRPVAGRVIGRFGPNAGPFNTVIIRHGLVFGAPPGSEVQAVVDGRVLYIGWMQGYGNLIIIDHGQRYYTLTGGLSGLRHEVGQWVRKGEILGVVPKGSQVDEKDIYFEIRHRGQAMNPAPWLGNERQG